MLVHKRVNQIRCLCYNYNYILSFAVCIFICRCVTVFAVCCCFDRCRLRCVVASLRRCVVASLRRCVGSASWLLSCHSFDIFSSCLCVIIFGVCCFVFIIFVIVIIAFLRPANLYPVVPSTRIYRTDEVRDCLTLWPIKTVNFVCEPYLF